MIRRKKSSPERSGVAAVEFAIIMPVMALLIVGLWEVGRMVEVQQYLANSVREGARQASTGVKTTDQVKTAVVNYLTQKGLTKPKSGGGTEGIVTVSDVTVTSVSNASITDPSLAKQLDQFRVTVTVPVNRDGLRWIALNRITTLTNLTASADWYSMRDLPLEVSDVIPLN